jgi:tripartite-type tricarboxylate transporter receptor subunit TctC
VVRDWQGVVAKSGTPQDVVDKVNKALNTTMKSEKFKTSLFNLGADPAPGTPQEFRTLIDSEVERWSVVARQGNLKVD